MAVTATNITCELVERPKTQQINENNFSYRTHPISLQAAPGRLLVEVIYVSVEPAMRGWMSQDTYLPKVKLNKPMRAQGAGRVISIGDGVSGFKLGQWVQASVNVQTYVSVRPKHVVKLPESMNPLLSLSVFGATGQTAYWGLREIGKPKAGETILVSGAAGGVGAIVCQLAKHAGLRVVGIAGSDEKCEFIQKQYDLDGTINYKKVKKWSRAIRKNCPKGVDIYWDNVGGECLEAAIQFINLRGRVVLCGGISQYGKKKSDIFAPRSYLALISQRAKMEGFIVIDYMHRVREMMADVVPLVQSGAVKQDFTIVKSIYQYVPCFNKLFDGQKKGKLFLQVGDLEEPRKIRSKL